MRQVSFNCLQKCFLYQTIIFVNVLSVLMSVVVNFTQLHLYIFPVVFPLTFFLLGLLPCYAILGCRVLAGYFISAVFVC